MPIVLRSADSWANVLLFPRYRRQLIQKLPQQQEWFPAGSTPRCHTSSSKRASGQPVSTGGPSLPPAWRRHPQRLGRTRPPAHTDASCHLGGPHTHFATPEQRGAAAAAVRLSASATAHCHLAVLDPRRASRAGAA